MFSKNIVLSNRFKRGKRENKNCFGVFIFQKILMLIEFRHRSAVLGAFTREYGCCGSTREKRTRTIKGPRDNRFENWKIIEKNGKMENQKTKCKKYRSDMRESAMSRRPQAVPRNVFYRDLCNVIQEKSHSTRVRVTLK